MPFGTPTLIRTRYQDTYKTVIALASYRHASGHVFLLHRASQQWTATYAPLGLNIGTSQTIDMVIDRLERISSEHCIEILKDRIEEVNGPLFSSEYGIPGTWQHREQWRMDTGEYRALPRLTSLENADLHVPIEHWAHVSTEDSGMIAYTPNANYGERDRQVRLKIGKYFKKVFPEASDTVIQSAVVELRAKLAGATNEETLHFTTERATINEIFETQMCACNSTQTSCMHGKFTKWKDRPYHVYADSPDVAVAYLTVDGDIVARTVVSTKDKTWIRLYATDGCETKCERLRQTLADAGYREGELDGNRLTKLPMRGHKHVLPYIDCGGLHVEENGSRYWNIVGESGGDYDCSNTDGTADCITPKCSRCDHDEDDCQCIYCECCEESYADGCDNCTMCEECDRCREHGACECSICEECNRPLEHRNYRRACQCERCSECNELLSICDCDRCTFCNELTDNCECTTDVETENEKTVTDVEMETESEVITSDVA